MRMGVEWLALYRPSFQKDLEEPDELISLPEDLDMIVLGDHSVEHRRSTICTESL